MTTREKLTNFHNVLRLENLSVCEVIREGPSQASLFCRISCDRKLILSDFDEIAEKTSATLTKNVN